MKKILFVIAVLFPVLGFSQGVRFDSIVIGPRGPIPNPVISVCTALATGTPCTIPATTYTDVTTNTPCTGGSQVTLTQSNTCVSSGDSNGNFGFWLKPGAYKYSVTGSGIVGQTYDLTVGAGSVSTNSNFTMTQPTLATSGANQSSFSLCEQGNFWTGATSAIDQWCFADILGAGTNPTSTYTLTHSGSSGLSLVSLPALSTTTASQFNGRIYVDGTKYPVTQAGIQQAFTDACTFGPSLSTEVFLPQMQVNVNTADTLQHFLITCALRIHGVGQLSTWFVCPGGCSSSVPMFRIQPNNVNSQSYGEIDHLRIVGTTSGGDAILFDGTNTGITGPNNWRIHDTSIDNLAAGSWAINMVGQNFPLNQQGFHHIYDNTFAHGINMLTGFAVDNWLIDHNAWNQIGGETTPCVNATTTNGAANITFSHNTGSCAGGIFISHGTTQCKIVENQMEQLATSVEANSAMIDLIGDTFNIDNCEIHGNNLNAHTNVTNNIRIQNATNTKIYNNSILTKPTTGVGILTVANAADTQAYNNVFTSGGGGAVNTSLGSQTAGATSATVPGSAFKAAYSWNASLDACGPTTGINHLGGNQFSFLQCGVYFLSMAGSTQFNLGSGISMNWSSGDPTGTAGDTGFSRGAPALIFAGNGTAGNKTGIVQSGNTVRLTSPFTSANASGLQVITGLSVALPSLANNYSFHCSLQYSQATPVAGDQWGVASLTTAPTQLRAWSNTITTEGATAVQTTGDSGAITSTTPTAIVTFTPVGTGVKQVSIDGSLEAAGGGASTLQFYVTNGTAANVIVIARDSYCQIY